MFYDKNGLPLPMVSEWLQECKEVGVVGYMKYDLNGASINVFARFSGLLHGMDGDKPLVFELGITGDPKNLKHAGLHGRHEKFADEAACLSAFNAACADVVKAGAKTVVVGVIGG